MSLPSPNITHKFIGYLIFLSIVPLLVLGVVSFRISSNIIQSETSRYIMELVTHQQDYLELQLGQIESLVANLSGVEEIRTALETVNTSSNDYAILSTQAHIGYILNGYSNLKGLVSIDIFSVNGIHYHVGDTLNVENIHTDVRDRIFAQALDSDRSIQWIGIEDNVNASSTHAKVVIAAKVLYRVNRETLQQVPIALMLVNYSAEYLQQHFKQVDLGENAYLIVVDSQNRIIYHPDSSLLGKQIDSALAQLISSPRGSEIANLEQGDMSINFVRSDLSDWTVIGLIPIDTLNAKSATIQNAVLIVLLICFVAVAIIAWVYNRNVVTPIREMTQQFKQFQQGTDKITPHYLPIRGHDEIAELSRWFNTTKTLYHASRTLITRNRLADLLQSVVNDLVDAISANRVSLITVDLEAQQITRFIKGGIGSDLIDTSVTFDELSKGLSGWVWNEQKPIISPKGSPDPREGEEAQRRRAATKCGDIIVIPLLYHGEVRGTVTAINGFDDRDFTEQDVELMVALTNQAAIAIENAQLVDSLRVSEEKFVKAFRASPEPMVITSLLDRRLIEINESFLTVTRYQREEVINNTALELGLWNDPNDYARFLEIARRQGTVRNFEATICYKSGERGEWLLSSEVVELSGEPCLLTVVKDITQRKQAEQQRVELVLERERVQILANFITEVSHEFKTPLSIINTNAYLLEKSPHISAQEASRIESITTEVKVIGLLVDSLTFMTKLDSGVHDIVINRVDLNEILRVIYLKTESIVQEKNLSYVLELSDSPLSLKGDAVYLRRAFEAICENAIQYSLPGGSINIRSLRRGNMALVEISDTGIGIEKADLPHIFERFFQSDKAGTIRGFGLGLSIAKAVIELHHGRIEVESVVAQGSTFRIWLPVN